MIYRTGSAYDIDAVLVMLEEMHISGRTGAHFHWTQNSLQEELWQYHFVLASQNDVPVNSLSEIKSGQEHILIEPSRMTQVKSTDVAAFIAYRYLGDQFIEISALATANRYLRQNIMFNLMNYLLEAEKPTEIWLEVHEKNQAAIEFYQRLKFVNTGRRPNYYGDRAAALNFVWKLAGL